MDGVAIGALIPLVDGSNPSVAFENNWCLVQLGVLLELLRQGYLDMRPLDWISLPCVLVLVVCLLLVKDEQESKSCAFVPFGPANDVAAELSNNLFANV